MAGRRFTRPAARADLGGPLQPALGEERSKPDQRADVDRTEVVERVDVGVAELDAQVQVGHEVARVSPAGAYDRLALGHEIAATHQQGRHPGVGRLEPPAMVDREEEAPAHRPGERDLTVCGGYGDASRCGGDVDA